MEPRDVLQIMGLDSLAVRSNAPRGPNRRSIVVRGTEVLDDPRELPRASRARHAGLDGQFVSLLDATALCSRSARSRSTRWDHHSRRRGRPSGRLSGGALEPINAERAMIKRRRGVRRWDTGSTAVRGARRSSSTRRDAGARRLGAVVFLCAEGVTSPRRRRRAARGTIDASATITTELGGSCGWSPTRRRLSSGHSSNVLLQRARRARGSRTRSTRSGVPREAFATFRYHGTRRCSSHFMAQASYEVGHHERRLRSQRAAPRDAEDISVKLPRRARLSREREVLGGLFFGHERRTCSPSGTSGSSSASRAGRRWR